MCEAPRSLAGSRSFLGVNFAHIVTCFTRLVTVSNLRGLSTNKKRCLIHSRYAPDPQHRQCALMQKVMVPAKPWGSTPRRFRIVLASLGAGRRRVGTCLRNLSRRRSKVHGADEHGPVLSHWGTYANSAALRNALLQWCYSTRNFSGSGESPQHAQRPPTGWKWTLFERVRVRVMENVNGSKGPHGGVGTNHVSQLW